MKTAMVWTGGVAFLALFVLASVLGFFRIAFAVTILSLVVSVALIRPAAGLIACIVFLGFLGEIRRLLIGIDGWPTLDPLLLISGAVMAVYVAPLMAARQIQLDTAVSKAVVLLMAWMVLQMFNPAQGSLVVGVTGAMFFLVPISWFWVGRCFVSTELLEIIMYRVFIVIAVLAGIMGAYQAFFGYLPHQMDWYWTAGYAALGPPDHPKPVSFYPSSVEHATVLSVGILILVAQVFRGGKKSALVLAFGLFLCVVFVGSRGPVVRVIVAVAAMWAILGTSPSTWISRGVLGLVIGATGLYWSSSQVAQIDIGGSVGQHIEHQASAFVDPLDKESSTATIHWSMFVNGIRRGIAKPLGYGLGATTPAAVKFGGRARSSELDISDMFLSGGVVGGLIYFVMILLVARSALYTWQHERSVIVLVICGTLVLTLGAWLAGGLYFMSTVLWIMVGTMDGRHAAIEKEQAALSGEV